MKYVVTGATGGLGSRVFKHLLDIVSPSDIIVSLYNPSGATSAVKSSGVEIRKGDFTKPETLDSAFAGADKLLIVSYPSIAYEIRVQSHKAAIEAAKRCGIKHVYYTSLAFAGDSAAAVMKAHLETEAYLKGSGMTYTIIREGIYNESWPLYFGFFDVSQKKKEVVIPISDGKIAWVCRDDLGEGTAKIMTSESGYENTTLLLSGTDPISLHELGNKINKRLPEHRQVNLKVVSENDYCAHNFTNHEDWFLHAWATTYNALARKELETVDPLLRNLLGRELKSIDDTLDEMLGNLVIESSSTEVLGQYAK
ncbi:hypothetical protein NLI96_g2055 [Meripilus lineatus]|uniref:NmrA-like domain-containing protein n=1 Tax=Meripilus lineatus TaxID=2056292 RepID=A0AAD5VBR0_9APHY|nr:hypothetical protein NLI96_g2055 [Physisporinus lineatus]